MELIILMGIIIFLILFIVFKEILQYRERDMLTKKLMSKNFVEYTNADLAKAQILKKETEPATLQRF